MNSNIKNNNNNSKNNSITDKNLFQQSQTQHIHLIEQVQENSHFESDYLKTNSNKRKESPIILIEPQHKQIKINPNTTINNNNNNINYSEINNRNKYYKYPYK